MSSMTAARETAEDREEREWRESQLLTFVERFDLSVIRQNLEAAEDTDTLAIPVNTVRLRVLIETMDRLAARVK